MGYSVQIKFRGLCALIPGEEPEANNEPRWAGMFLVNANQKNSREFKIDRPQHFPFFKFNLKDVDGVANAPDTITLQELSFEDIVFVPPAGSDDKLRLNFRTLVGKVPEEERLLLNWVPRVEDMMTNKGKVHADCFGTSSRLVARVHLTRGRLDTASIGTVGNVPILVRLGESGIEQAVAGSVVLTIQCEDGPFCVKFRKFAGGEPKEIVFRQPTPPDKRLDLAVWNLCADELPVGDNGSLRQSTPGPDEDFRWFYILSQDVPADFAAAPVPAPAVLIEPDPNDGGGTDTARCSPPRFTAPVGTEVSSMLGIVTDLS